MGEAAAGMRCDLHVHSVHSGFIDVPFLGSVSRECYSEPRAVYERARTRGMDLVTLTDHDSIEGALEIAGLPGTFVSEEVTCLLPGGRELHLGVFDITETQHRRIAALRTDAEGLFAYLAEERIPAAANHLFSALTGARATEDFDAALGGASLVEARNGMMPHGTNAFARAVARAAGIATVGGSDAHTLASVARAHTVVPGARTRDEFLDGLRRGLTIPGGTSGSYRRLTGDVLRIAAGGYAERALAAPLGPGHLLRLAGSLVALPLLALVPVVMIAVYGREVAFGVRHHRLYRARAARRASGFPGNRGPFGPAAAGAMGAS